MRSDQLTADQLTVGMAVALTDGAVGVVMAIADDDDPTVPDHAPVRVRLQDEGQVVQVSCEEIAEIHTPRS